MCPHTSINIVLDFLASEMRQEEEMVPRWKGRRAFVFVHKLLERLCRKFKGIFFEKTYRTNRQGHRK